MLAWGKLVYWLSAMTTVGIIIYLVWSRAYPERIDFLSFICWGQACLWFLSLVPLGLGINYQTRLKVLADWPTWRRKIGLTLSHRQQLSEAEVQHLMGADPAEAREAMKLFARQTGAVIEEDSSNKLILKRLDGHEDTIEGPKHTSESKSTIAPSKLSRAFDLPHFQDLFKFANSTLGLNMPRNEAVAWAESNVDFFSTHDFSQFQKLVQFARSYSGLNMNGADVVNWAKVNLDLFSTIYFI